MKYKNKESIRLSKVKEFINENFSLND